MLLTFLKKDRNKSMVEGKGVGDLYNLGYSIAQNALSRNTYGRIPIIGEAMTLANYFTSSATSAIDEARRMGASGDQAVASGIAKGAWEVGTEVFGLDNLYKMGPAVTWGDLFKQLGVQGLFEAFGEGTNAALGYISDNYILGDLSEYQRTVQSYIDQGETEENAKWKAFLDAAKNVGFEALSGAVSGWVSGGLETGMKTAMANQYYRNVNPQSLIDAGMNANADSKAYQLAKQMQERVDNDQRISGNQKRVLAYNTELQQLAEAKVAAENAAMEDLAALGETGNLEDLARIVAKRSMGEDLTRKEQRTIRGNENVQALFTALGDTGPAETAAEDATPKKPIEKPKVSTDDRSIQISTENPIDALDFAEMKNGKATIQLKDGGTVDYSDVSFASEAEANQFYAVSTLPGIETEAANNLLHTIQEADAGKDDQSVIGIREAYRLGYMGAQASDLAKSDAAVLTPDLQSKVFEIGRNQRTADAMAKPTAQAVNAKPADGYKKVVFEGKTTKITKKHSAEIAFVDYIAENFSGNTVHVYESYRGRDGKYYYRDSNGKVNRAPNGKYVNGEIWLDLKAGDNGEGLMLNTFAHEMYHHIEKFNKAKAQELAEFVVRELGIESVDKAIEEQIKKARKAGLGETYFVNVKGMTQEQARNEVYTRAMSDFVADSLETVFTRGNAAETIAKLHSENRTLFDEIKAFIDNWVSKLKKFYSDKTISQEGAVVAQLKNFEQLQRMFMEAMQGAGENYRAAEISEEQVEQADRDPEADEMYSLRGVNKDGIEVYETSDEVKKLSYKERQQRFLDIMKNEYRGRTAKFIRNGHSYYATFEEKDINKNIYGDKLSDIKGWKAKINTGADGDIFELVENARYNGSLPEKGKKIAAHQGVRYWDYFIKTVQIDDAVFDLVANVRKKADGAFVYSIQLRQNKKIKASPPLGLLLKALDGVTNASGDMVSQPDPIVNQEMNSLRNEKAETTRDILSRIDVNTRNKAEKYHLGLYQDRLSQLADHEEKLALINAQIEEGTSVHLSV